MRKLTWLAASAAVALAATGAAIGQPQHDRSADPVSATFTATTVGPRTSATCTSADGTYQITNAAYSGQSTGDPSLTGSIRLAVRTAINTAKRLGTVDGIVVISRPGRTTRARLTGVYADGKVDGLLSGQTATPGERLVATFTAGYGSDGGFTDGSIGTGTQAAAGLRSTEGACRVQPAPAGELKLLGGTVSTLTTTSLAISLAAGSSFSCSLDDHARAEISSQHVAVGDRVAAACTFKDGAWLLLRIKKLG